MYKGKLVNKNEQWQNKRIEMNRVITSEKKCKEKRKYFKNKNSINEIKQEEKD